MGGITGGALSRQPIQIVSVEHEGKDEILNRFVRADGARCVADERPIGVGQASSTKDGEVVPVATGGIVTVVAGAAIALSNGEKAVRTDAEGRAIAHVAGKPIAGYVIDAAAKKDVLVRCILP
ncbi:MAG: DUF2190 family protein [Acidobacteriota bacterium]|nr:DUF2190 family protein [Acidobacteriota bacterium]